MQGKKLGAATNQVLVEDFMKGREMSFFAFSDGTTVLPLVSACDYNGLMTMIWGRIPAAWAATALPFLVPPRCRKNHGNRYAADDPGDGTGRQTIPQRALRRIDGR